MSTDGGREILRQMFRHHTWANLGLLYLCEGAADTVPEAALDGTYGAARDILVHLAAAEGRYVALLTGEWPAEPLRESDGFPGYEALRTHVTASGRSLEEIAGRLEPDDTWSGDYRGASWEIDKVVVLVQAINHATEHREQVKVTLTQAGIEAPNLDGWTYGYGAGLMRPQG